MYKKTPRHLLHRHAPHLGIQRGAEGGQGGIEPAKGIDLAADALVGAGYGSDPDLLKTYHPGDVWPLTLTAAQANDLLSKVGSPATVSAAPAGDAVYALGGSVPATQLSRVGAQFVSPEQTNLFSERMAALQAQQQQKNMANLTAALQPIQLARADLRAKQPTLAASIADNSENAREMTLSNRISG